MRMYQNQHKHESKVTIWYKQQVKIDKTIPTDKLDIIVTDSEEGICLLLDIAISVAINGIKKEAEKFFRC